MSIRLKIRGTGKDGRLTKDDVIAAAEAQKASARRRPGPRRRRRSAGSRDKGSASWAPAFAGDERREERVKMTRLRQTIASASRKRRTPPRC